MRHGSRLANFPLRLAVGAYIVNSGVAKLQADKETAAGLHGMAATAYPSLESAPPEAFTKGLGLAEVGLGSAVMLPVVSDGLAGAGLAAFSSGLVGFYLKSPGMRREGSVRPSEQGTGYAKDVWLAGAAAALLAHSLGARRQAWHQSRLAERARRAAKAAAKAQRASARAEGERVRAQRKAAMRSTEIRARKAGARARKRGTRAADAVTGAAAEALRSAPAKAMKSAPAQAIRHGIEKAA